MSAVEHELMPHQDDMMADTTTRVIGLASGYGGGKTWIATRKHIYLMTLNPGVDSIFAEPTNPLLIKLAIPELKNALDMFGIRYRFVKSEKIFYCLVNGLDTRIVCESMENYERLIGLNASHITLDEFDTTKAEIAYLAFERLLGRLRAGNVRQMNIVSTPEGFRAMYQIFVADVRDNPDRAAQRRLIKARSIDNHYLPADFIQTMFAGYDEKLIQAYIYGEFVNLKSGVVYHKYDPDMNDSNQTIEPGETLYIGQDFNVGKMASVVYVERDNGWHAVAEITDGFDTPDVISKMQAAWQSKEDYHPIIIYPDASGKNRKSVTASKTDISLLEDAGFEVRASAANPAVKDRINAANALLCNAKGERRLFVNRQACPVFSDCLLRQAWSEKTGEPEKGGANDPSHMNDAGTYPIVYEFPIIRPATDIQVEFW